MTTLETIRTFLGWCTLIHIGLLLLTAVALGTLRAPVLAIHGRLSGLGEPELLRAYFQYLAQYKIAVIVFSLVPYLALRIMS